MTAAQMCVVRRLVCVWPGAFTEAFQPQKAGLAASDRAWESVLHPNQLLGLWSSSWISHGYPLFSVTLHSWA